MAGGAKVLAGDDIDFRSATVRRGFLGFLQHFCFLFASRVDSVSVPVVLFCQCGSDRVDIAQWNGTRARLLCFTCEREAWLDGFTVSDLDPVRLTTAALVDQARKHRKRSPQEMDALKRARNS